MAPSLDAEIKDIVSGDDIEIRRTVLDVPSGQVLSKAWFTLKNKITDADTAALFQKVITAANTVGVGQIEDDGASDQIAVLRFDLTDVDTKLLTGGKIYYYDIQVLTDAGKIYTPEAGKFKTVAEVTRASS
jgi:hypothetical protein